MNQYIDVFDPLKKTRHDNYEMYSYILDGFFVLNYNSTIARCICGHSSEQDKIACFSKCVGLTSTCTVVSVCPTLSPGPLAS